MIGVTISFILPIWLLCSDIPKREVGEDVETIGWVQDLSLDGIAI